VYANGTGGVLRDEAETVRLYRLSAEQGNAGVRDEAEAVRLYTLSAEQGEPDAQYDLAVCYANGRGVRQDEAEAVRLYRQSAEQDNARHSVILDCVMPMAQESRKMQLRQSGCTDCQQNKAMHVHMLC